MSPFEDPKIKPSAEKQPCLRRQAKTPLKPEEIEEIKKTLKDNFEYGLREITGRWAHEMENTIAPLLEKFHYLVESEMKYGTNDYYQASEQLGALKRLIEEFDEPQTQLKRILAQSEETPEISNEIFEAIEKNQETMNQKMEQFNAFKYEFLPFAERLVRLMNEMPDHVLQYPDDITGLKLRGIIEELEAFENVARYLNETITDLVGNTKNNLHELSND